MPSFIDDECTCSFLSSKSTSHVREVFPFERYQCHNRFLNVSRNLVHLAVYFTHTVFCGLVLLKELSEWNQKYEERFGHVFLICASGKSCCEVLTALQVRDNSRLSLITGKKRVIDILTLHKYTDINFSILIPSFSFGQEVKRLFAFGIMVFLDNVLYVE
jgi:hypothetical protein